MSLAERLRALVSEAYRGSCDQNTQNALDKISALVDEIAQMEEYVEKMEDIIDDASKQFSV